MLRNGLIILTALLGVVFLAIFAVTEHGPSQSADDHSTDNFGTIQLLTTDLGNLSTSKFGIICGNSNGEIQIFASASKNTKCTTIKLSNNPISACILEHNNILYVGDESGIFYAYDLNAGLKWSYQTGNKIMGAAVMVNDMILVGSYDQKLYAINPDDGQIVYTVSCGSYINGTPALSASGDTIYLGSCDGMIRRIDTISGEITGQIELSSPIPASPILYDNILYAITHNGTLVAISTDRFEILYQNKNPGSFTASPYPSGQYIFLTDTQGHINIHSRHDGQFIAVFEDEIEMTPLQASRSNQYYAVSSHGKLVQYTMVKNHWQRQILHDFKTDCQRSCILFNQICFITDDSGGLYFYEVSK